MLFQVKLKILYPSLSVQTIRDIDTLVDCETGEPRVKWLLERAASDSYWRKIVTIAKQNLGTTDEKLINVVEKVVEFTGYTLAELKKELKDMSLIVNRRS